MFWTTLLSVLIFTDFTGTALGAALVLTGLIILYFFAAYIPIENGKSNF